MRVSQFGWSYRLLVHWKLRRGKITIFVFFITLLGDQNYSFFFLELQFKKKTSQPVCRFSFYLKSLINKEVGSLHLVFGYPLM